MMIIIKIVLNLQICYWNFLQIILNFLRPTSAYDFLLSLYGILSYYPFMQYKLSYYLLVLCTIITFDEKGLLLV